MASSRTSVVAPVSMTISTTTSLILTDALGILGAFESWFIVYRCSSSLLLLPSSCAAETWLTFEFWLCCCWWHGLVVDLVRHIFTKWFGFPHFHQVLPLAGHGLVLCGHVSPHWRHVFEHVCWGPVPCGLRGFVCFSWWTRLDLLLPTCEEDFSPFRLPASRLPPNCVLWPPGHQGWGHLREVRIFGVSLIDNFGWWPLWSRSLLVSWNSQLMAIFCNLVANWSTVLPGVPLAETGIFHSPRSSLARNTHRAFPEQFCSRFPYQCFENFLGLWCSLVEEQRSLLFIIKTEIGIIKVQIKRK